MLNFTVGPVMSSEEVRAIGCRAGAVFQNTRIFTDYV